MKDDDIIESFFEGMKKADARVPVPPFVKPVTRERIRSSNWLYYAAAMLATIVVCAPFLIRSPKDDPKKDEIPFSNPEVTETGSLLYTDEITMFDWQSPTDGLLEEF